MPKSARDIPLPGLMLSRDSGTPLSIQLYKGIRQLVLSGALRPGNPLPATRNLAAELGLSRNTVLTAYEQLMSEGYVEGRTGAGTRVAKSLPSNLLAGNRTAITSKTPRSKLFFSKRGELLASRPTARALSANKPRPFASGLPDLNAFPIRTWTRLMTKYSGRNHPNLLSYGEPAGYKPLRTAVADYIQSARAVRCTSDQVFIVNGSQQALDLCARLLLDPGNAVAVEEPGYPGALLSFQGAGAEIVPVPVDDAGIDISQVKTSARAVFVTPSHQYPLGVTMSISRRLLLLEWARRNRAWVLEDDYDSEFRYHSRPLPSLQGLDSHGQVIYIGTFSKTMFPSLRLGFLVLPESLTEGFRRARAVVDGHSSTVEQAALAEFIDDGHLSRHIRRMRELYAERQSALVEAAERHLAGMLRVVATEGGMQMVGWLSEGANDVAIAHKTVAAGVNCRPLSLCYTKRSHPRGLLLGFAAFSTAEIRAGISKLAQTLEAVL